MNDFTIKFIIIFYFMTGIFFSTFIMVDLLEDGIKRTFKNLTVLKIIAVIFYMPCVIFLSTVGFILKFLRFLFTKKIKFLQYKPFNKN